MPVASGQILKRLIAIGEGRRDCWQWLGAKNESGYGVKEQGGKTITAARWVWLIFFGKIDNGFLISPNCGNPDCVSPFHLRAVDQATINRESRSGLTPEDVKQIRLDMTNGAWGDDQAKRYDVDPSTIYRIANRSTWKKPGRVTAGARV